MNPSSKSQSLPRHPLDFGKRDGFHARAFHKAPGFLSAFDCNGGDRVDNDGYSGTPLGESYCGRFHAVIRRYTEYDVFRFRRFDSRKPRYGIKDYRLRMRIRKYAERDFLDDDLCRQPVERAPLAGNHDAVFFQSRAYLSPAMRSPDAMGWEAVLGKFGIVFGVTVDGRDNRNAL